MGEDYYKILKVNRNASEDEIRKSYKQLAMEWHPDKNPTRKSEAEAKFKEISEAYAVLRDPTKRRGYDSSREEALRSSTVPPPPTSSSASASSNGSQHTGRFNSRTAEDMFGGSEWNFDPGPEMVRTFRDGFYRTSNGAGGEMRQADTVVRHMAFSLEELFKGVPKKFNTTRTVPDPATGRIRNVDEVLEIEIKPGYKEGTKVTFPGRGNYVPGFLPADVAFVVVEKPHPVYQRDGNDLVIKQTITLLESLTGKTLELTTLDDRHISIPLTEIIKPGYEMTVPNEGMPISRNPTQKGNLRIKFDVEFPTKLAEEQKNGLKRLLG